MAGLVGSGSEPATNIGRQPSRDRVDRLIDLAFRQRSIVSLERESEREALLGIGEWPATVDVEEGG